MAFPLGSVNKNYIKNFLDMKIKTIYTSNMFYNLLIAKRVLKAVWHLNAVAGGGFY